MVLRWALAPQSCVSFLSALPPRGACIEVPPEQSRSVYDTRVVDALETPPEPKVPRSHGQLTVPPGFSLLREGSIPFAHRHHRFVTGTPPMSALGDGLVTRTELSGIRVRDEGIAHFIKEHGGDERALSTYPSCQRSRRNGC